jgi:hypothetical protein
VRLRFVVRSIKNVRKRIIESKDMKKLIVLLLILNAGVAFADRDTLGVAPMPSKDKDALRVNLSEDGSRYFQAVFLNQVWARWNQSNPGTTVMGKPASETFDIGLRRTRVQMYGQVTDRAFLYFQFGQNNLNSMYASNPAGNRKVAAFFHDALGEYRVTNKNQLKIGGGLTIANGLSRFSQPSVGTILSLDVPVFAQSTVDQTDQFARKLSLYARGQLYRFDYRIALSDPFPVVSNGVVPAPISGNSSFAQKGKSKQFQSYLMFQFLEHENHTTPYMTGTYLGKKNVFNVAGGLIHQGNAMWQKEANGDTTYSPMTLWCVESFLDVPINKDKGTALSAYAGYFHYNYGKNYLRYNGIMNPANGTMAANTVAAGAWGNAFPMFGTGKVVYAQAGFLLPQSLLGEKGGQLLPYASIMSADFQKLKHRQMNVFDVGVNWLMNGHKTKLTIDYQIRPVYETDLSGAIHRMSGNKSSVILQYQIMI